MALSFPLYVSSERTRCLEEPGTIRTLNPLISDTSVRTMSSFLDGSLSSGLVLQSDNQESSIHPMLLLQSIFLPSKVGPCKPLKFPSCWWVTAQLQSIWAWPQCSDMLDWIIARLQVAIIIQLANSLLSFTVPPASDVHVHNLSY